jgi:hypothetical protein
MSIYEGRSGLMGYDDVHEVPVANNVSVPAPSADSSAGSRAWLRYRKTKPIDRLLPISDRWLDRLPLDMYPSALATQYPRIVNLIALQWSDSHACCAYFDELLVDRRGARQGFPLGVRRDLLRLRDHWCIRVRMPKV